MERMTERWCAGGIRIKGCSTLYPDVERKSAPMASAIARLAAYEDTMTIERAKELAQAEKDGRLVVHGMWVESDIPGSMLSKCTVCGFRCGAYTFNFCPNCGAKMDLSDAALKKREEV